jgi:hypothetical protein
MQHRAGVGLQGTGYLSMTASASVIATISVMY